MIATFLSHEARTQLRSARYRAIAFVYTAVCVTPAVITYVLSKRATYFIGSATYAWLLDLFQPFLTTLLAMILSVDAISRERDEGSFPVIALAPVSATGYLVRRWMAVLLLTLPLTIAPRLIAAAIAGAGTHQLPLLSAFAGGWLIRVVPVLILMSALTIALGTINTNTIVSMVATIVLLTIVMGSLNDFLIYIHRNYEGAGDLVGFDPNHIRRLTMIASGWYGPRFPTDAGYEFAAQLDRTLTEGALLFGVTAIVFGIATRHLRRTKRDLRPWRVRDDHPLRSFVKVINRWRDDYARDAAPEWPERAALVAGFIGLTIAGVYLVRRDNHFIALAREHYECMTGSEPQSMAPSLAPVAARVRGTIGRNGSVRLTSDLTMRNDGSAPQTHLAFTLNDQLAVRRMTVNRGRATIKRVGERLGVTLDPPLAAGESRTLMFDLAGVPGIVDYSLRWSGGFPSQWRRYRDAKTSFDISDLSRSTVIRHVDETRMQLGASSLIPVPRYTPWNLEGETHQFIQENVTPETAIDLEVDQGFPAAADSYGTLTTTRRLASRCSAALVRYVLFGGPMATRSLSEEATLMYLPAHARLMSIHAPALTGSIAIVGRVWPGLKRRGNLIFVERPAEFGERDWGEWVGWMSLRNVGASGALQFLGENAIRSYKPIEGGRLAASIIVNSLTSQRRMVEGEGAFFRAFCETVALQHTGGTQKRDAVVPAVGGVPPRKQPLVGQQGWERVRMEKILASLEWRIGGDALIGGINDFAAAGPLPGDSKELFAAIAKRAHTDLDRFYSDYVIGDHVPRLTFADIAFKRLGSTWEVTGVVKNEGTGEALCPIALRTSQGSLWQTPRVGGGETLRFVFTTPSAPLTLQLDPERVCYRDAFVGAIESADYKGDA